DIMALEREFRAERYFGSLDGLRAFSIIPVIWHHSTVTTHAGALGRGPIGVDLFFAISGFLITTLLVRERMEKGSLDLAGFYLRRSLRIFPLYYGVLILHCIYAFWVRPDWPPCQVFLQRWQYYATYTANWFRGSASAGPVLFVFAWSLCTEEQFYAFWAPILKYVRRLWVAAVVMGILVSIDLLLECRVAGSAKFAASLPFVVVTSFATPIGFGSLLALALQHRRLGGWLLYGFGQVYSAPAIALLLACLVVWPWAPLLVVHLLLAGLVVSCSVRRDNGLAQLLDNLPMHIIGRASYGIYLLHVPVIGAVRSLLPQLRNREGIVFALSLPISVAVASASFAAIEQPLTQWGKRIGRRGR
ncbi:MAG TPA: acyltransferase, partial [Polyangiaceae bacterium]